MPSPNSKPASAASVKSPRPPAVGSQRPTPSGKPASKVWAIDDLRRIQTMAVDGSKEMLREIDKRGLSPVSFAAFQAALSSDSLLPLLSLLEPKEGESKIDVLVSAIEKVLDTQKQIIAEQAVMKLMLVKIGRKLGA